MSIIRINKPRGEFAVLPKQAINDANLSWEARGMLAYLLDKPDSWQVRFVDLIRQSPAGRDQTRRILHELQDAGYIVRHQVRNEDGTFDWRSEVHETPQVVEAAPPVHNLPEEPLTGNQYMEPLTGNPSTVKPSTVNQYIYQELSEQEPSEQELSSEDGDEEAAPPGASVWEKAPEPDPEQGARRAALDKLQQRGLFNPIMLAQFDDMWPELYGLRLGWIDDAIAVADHAKAYSPAYVLKVLANALHIDKPPAIPAPRPASRSGRNGKQPEHIPDDYKSLKSRYVPAGFEDIIEH